MAAYADRAGIAPRTLSESEQKALLTVSGQRRDGYRDYVIFTLALGTGLREHEITSLNVGDVFRDGRAVRRVSLRVFKTSNSDPESQQVLLSDLVRARLDRFLTWKRRNGEPVLPDSPLFMSRNHERLSDRQLRRAFAVWQERAGFQVRFRFHALRHTACTNLYRATRDIRLTQRFARHLSLASTAIYTHPTDEDMLRALQTIDAMSM